MGKDETTKDADKGNDSDRAENHKSTNAESETLPVTVGGDFITTEPVHIVSDSGTRTEIVTVTPIKGKGKTVLSDSGLQPTNKSVTVKAIKGTDNEIEILVPYGGPAELGGVDRQGEYFTPETVFSMPTEPDVPAVPDLPRTVLYYHGAQDKTPTSVGTAVSVRDAPEGKWYRVILSRTGKRFQQIVGAVRDGMLLASSQALVFSVRTVKEAIGDRITHWPLTELTVIDTRNRGEAPANPLARVEFAHAQKSLSAVGIELITKSGGGDADAATRQNQQDGKDKEVLKEEFIKMDEQELQEKISAGVVAGLEAAKTAETAVKEAAEARETEIADAVEVALKAEREKKDAKEGAEKRRIPGGGDDEGAPYVAKFGELRKYDSLGAGDLSVMLGILEAAKNPAGENAYKALAVKLREPDSSETTLAAKVAGDLDKAGLPLKANEINQSTFSSYGDEWVGITYSTQLWQSIRVGTPILEQMSAYSVEIPQGSESIIIPLESTDPIWYVVGQTTGHNATTGIPDATVPDSNLGTAQKTLSANKLGARTMFSSELTEDSLIPWAAQLRMQMELSGADYLESAIIDGDTTRTNGINDVAGTAATTDWHVAFNGMRHSGLVTTTANSRDGGVISDADFIETLRLMGVQGKNASIDTTAFILSPPVYWKVMQLAELKTQDVFSRATLEEGALTRIWNYPVFLSYNYDRSSLATSGYEYLENASGKIDLDTAGNNTKGSFMAVRWNQWLMGYKRRFTIKTSEFIESDAHQIVAMMRVGLAQRDTEASAISYNLTV